MHVLISRNALLEVLGAATGVVASRSPKEVLKCVRLTASQDGLLVSATDLEVALRGEVRQVEVKVPGDVLIPADKLLHITRESADDALELESNEQTCHIRGSDSHYEIYGQDPRDFPPVADLEGRPDVEIEGGKLLSLIERTVFAVARENTRFAINGVLWEKKGKKLALVATDGRRMACAVDVAERVVGEDAAMIVPARTVQALQRVLAGVTDLVAISFSRNQVVVRTGAYVISSALVEGQFPQYEEVIPVDNDRKVVLATDAFLSAVRRAALLTNDQSKGIRLCFEDNRLVLSSRAPEQGEATVSMPAECGGRRLEIGFNPSFLTDALRVVGTPTVQLELRDANRPGLLRAGPGFVYVVMPVSLA